VVIAIRMLTLLLLIVSGWYLFRAPGASEIVQVTSGHCPAGYPYKFLGTCYQGETQSSPGGLALGGEPSGSSVSDVSEHDSVTFSCLSVWDIWVSKASYTKGGTTFSDLTGTWSPDYKIFDAPNLFTSASPYQSASMSCVGSNHGRMHLFWTFLVLAALALFASEVVRREMQREA